VEKVYRAAPAMQAFAGQTVTVQLEKAAGVTEGQILFFFANGLKWAEHVAVKEEGHLEGEDIPQRVGKMLAKYERSQLRERIDATDAVVIGVVQGLAAAEPSMGSKSEHDPNWWKATILVSAVQKKGKAQMGKTVEVYFANSRDIAWWKTPKFHPGDRGIVLLVKKKITGIDGEHYVADDPRDFLPIDRLDDIRTAISPHSNEVD
jgi:hypothetical protein